MESQAFKEKKMTKLKRGDKVTYTKQYAFGKSGEVTATVVMVLGWKALLDNGDEIPAVIA